MNNYFLFDYDVQPDVGKKLKTSSL